MMRRAENPMHNCLFRRGKAESQLFFSLISKFGKLPLHSSAHTGRRTLEAFSLPTVCEFSPRGKMWLTPELKEHLIYWKNPRDSGIVFGLVLVFLIGIKHVSIISVLANMSLALITSTMAFRIYKSVLSAVNKTQDGHPFKVSTYFHYYLPILTKCKL